MIICLIFGGPSQERGISLNSTRSLIDHLTPLGWKVIPLYCDPDLKFYHLSIEYLYSNTPSDFDFKLAIEKKPLNVREFIKICKETDIVFPVIHGAFGEDGELQKLLEKYDIPFVGSSSNSCHRMFNKVHANSEISQMNDSDFYTLPNCCIEEQDSKEIRLKKVTKFFEKNYNKKVVVKPSSGGSSIGVSVANTPKEAVESAEYIFSHKLGSCAMIEPYCKGKEFTVFVLQNPNDEPVALIPTEIDLKEEEILTYRDKYLPTCQIETYCPPRFTDEEIMLIRNSAEKLFNHFGMQDFSRIDGRILDDRLIISDINPISGLEQNSDLFIQGSRMGLHHGDILLYIITNALRRNNIHYLKEPNKKNIGKKKIRVLLGGETSERQVSLMSGTNVWLKLLHSDDYDPSPYLLAPNHEVWELPYSFALNYTVEEILYQCNDVQRIFSNVEHLACPILKGLGLPALDANKLIKPRNISFDQFCKDAKTENAFVFIALHGGEGENGQVQGELNRNHLAYNGSDVKASKLCMDKYLTSKAISDLDPQLKCAVKIQIQVKSEVNEEKIWDDAVWRLGTSDVIIKPQADGCSTGVFRLKSHNDLKSYLHALQKGKTTLEVNTPSCKNSIIELPKDVNYLILEPFIETDKIIVSGTNLEHVYKTGWIELTVGVLEDCGLYHSLTPSITVAEENVLSVEEKFQGGTGVNLTPPPDWLVKLDQIDLIKTKCKQVAKFLGIQGYARIDIFFNTKRDEIIVIEANTLPGLTPSTVIYHQALAEVPPMTPQEFLSKIIKFGIKRRMLAQAD